MKTEKEGRSVAWAWAFEYAPLLILVGISVALLVVVVLGRQLGRRLDNIENNLSERLRYTEPTTRVEADPSFASDDIAHSRSSYVPAHSHVYAGEGEAILLTVTLSIRNTDRRLPLRLNSAQYFDTKGKRIKEFVTKPTEVAPLETLEFLVGESDFAGGSGASFIVQWGVPDGANEPLIEAVMIGSADGQGISFVQRAIELDSELSSK